MEPGDVAPYNRAAWDRCVQAGNPWTVPVSDQAIARARRGEVSILLTPSKPVPADWLPPLAGLRVLGLASGGGQQGPILAAAGAEVVVLDNSPQQLEQDRQMADRHNLRLTTVEGDMANLQAFADGSFDLIVHPCSNCFSSQVLPVWREAYRVLKPGGTLLAGWVNPVLFLFDRELEATGVFMLKYSMPYADVTSLPAADLKALMASHTPLEFAHSLEDQIGGQLLAGFKLIGLYEDDWGGDDAIDLYFKAYLATRAEKPG